MPKSQTRDYVVLARSSPRPLPRRSYDFIALATRPYRQHGIYWVWKVNRFHTNIKQYLSKVSLSWQTDSSNLWFQIFFLKTVLNFSENTFQQNIKLFYNFFWSFISKNLYFDQKLNSPNPPTNTLNPKRQHFAFHSRERKQCNRKRSKKINKMTIPPHLWTELLLSVVQIMDKVKRKEEGRNLHVSAKFKKNRDIPENAVQKGQNMQILCPRERY